MKLGFIDDRFHMTYGAQRNVVLLARLAADAGHDVVFYTTKEGPLADEARRQGLEVGVVVAPGPLLVFEKGAVAGVGAAAATALALVRYNWSLARRLAADGREVMVPAAVRPALLCALWRLWPGRRMVLFAQNNSPFGVFAAAAGLVSDRIGLIGPDCERTFPSWARRVIASRFRPLASGRDLSVFAAVEPSEAAPGVASTDGRLRLLTVAAIEERKGIDVLLRAIAGAGLVDVVTLTVVGGASGPRGERHLAELEALAESTGVETRFAGWHDDVVPFLRDAELFVLASFEEGLPGVLIEAMAAGVACVTTAAGNAGDLVSSCGGGIVVPVGDEAALGAAIGGLVADRERREALAAAGRAQVGVAYSEAAFLERFEAILAEVR